MRLLEIAMPIMRKMMKVRNRKCIWWNSFWKAWFGHNYFEFLPYWAILTIWYFSIIFVFECVGKENDAGTNELDDLENFGKKKKKKKKPFNMDELENNLPSTENEDKKEDAVNDVAGDEGGNVENDYEFDLDFMKTKKKKKKKKDLDGLVADKTEEEQQIQSDNGRFKRCPSLFFVFFFKMNSSEKLICYEYKINVS